MHIVAQLFVCALHNSPFKGCTLTCWHYHPGTVTTDKSSFSNIKNNLFNKRFWNIQCK